MEQQTLADSFTLEGVGIHTGAHCRVTVEPHSPDAGRVFHVGGVEIPACADYVSDTARCTTLSHNGGRVSTVEHLLSALAGCGVDNARIIVEGPELPILDGSALPFAQAIQTVGLKQQDAPARLLTLSEPFTIEEGSSRITVTPAPDCTLEAVTEFADWPEGDTQARYHCGAEGMTAYLQNVAPARTFAFRREVEMLLAAGLAKGGSLDNALIITPPDTFSTPLRLPAEWCAHKLLDLIGDLALVDARLAMTVRAVRPGHRINTLCAQRLRALLA